MRTTQRWQRVAVAGTLALACPAACDTVLDIQDPVMRPSVGGEAGEPAGGVPNSGGSLNPTMPIGGEAGEPSTSGTGGKGGTDAVSGNAGQAGEAGAGGAPECAADAVRCGGDAAKSPEICDASGHWTPNTNEAAGDCPLLCDAGKCTVCVNDAKQCSVCEEGDAECSTNQPQKCVDGAWANDGDECKNYCDAGSCALPPSCPASAGARNNCTGGSCCNSLRVAGGTFSRDYDGTDNFFAKDQFPATISPFLLDKFEVTVGRMRAFLNAYDQLNLKDGAGKSPHIANDPGWSTDYTLPADKNTLAAQLKCADTTWSDTVTVNNDLPVNCVSFNLAYAFCIWDGARLPTEAEWNFAAAGGEEQRAYPWKAPSVGAAVTPEYAVYSSTQPMAVGSKALGNGRWGQADLAGNVAEWTLDYNQDYPDVCSDCLNITPAAERTERGGYYALSEDYLFVSARGYSEPTIPLAVIGFRCARDLN